MIGSVPLPFQVSEELLGWASRLFPALGAFLSSETATSFLQGTTSTSSTTDNNGSTYSSSSSTGSSSNTGSSGAGSFSGAPSVGGPWHAALVVEASVYDYLELLYSVEEVSGRESGPSLQLCAQVGAGN